MNLLQILSDQREEILQTDLGKLVRRKEEDEINIESSLAQVVVGVRRCGKSTLCKQVLLRSGVKFGYINFDDERLLRIGVDNMDDYLTALYQINGEFKHLFIDEIQNVQHWELFVNRMLRQGMRMIITGSNANLLGSDLTTHLVGRYNEIRLFPFSFKEYCLVKKVGIDGWSTKDEGLRRNLLDEYLKEGGFPEVVDGDMPPDYASNLLNTIVFKDICARYKIRYKETLWRLTNVVLDHVCQEQSSTKLAKDLGIKSFHTVDNYLSYLADAYLVCYVRKFSWKSIDRRRMPKLYAIDPSFISSHQGALMSESWGWRLENVVAIELFRRNGKSRDAIYFLKESRDYEVDFAVVKNSHITELIQVTFDFDNPSTKLYNREVGGLIKAAEKTGCTALTLIVGYGKPGIISQDGVTINVIRATDWLLNA